MLKSCPSANKNIQKVILTAIKCDWQSSFGTCPENDCNRQASLWLVMAAFPLQHNM